MRSSKFTAAVAAFVLVTGGSLLSAPAAFAAGTTYYVDAQAGSDTAAGTSTATAWKSLTKVNATTFAAGDRVLFQGGQTWSGSLAPRGSGTAGSPITLGAYGTGRPVINAGSLASGSAIHLVNQSWWTITGFELTNDSGTDNVGASGAGGAIRSGVLVEATSAQRGISITNNFVHNVNGCFKCSAYDAHFNGGIVVIADQGNPLSFGSGIYTDTVIANNTVSHIGRTGIIFGDNSTGFLTNIDQNALSQNVTIQNNAVDHVDSDGIMATGAKNVLIDHNTVSVGGTVTIAGSTEPSAAGIWPAKTNGVVVQYNEVSGMHTQQNVDGQGFDVDLFAQNTTVQYNYSHDNEGGFLLMEGGSGAASTNLTVRYNLSVNDAYTGAKGVFTFGYGVINNTSIYNNTVYVKSGLPSQILFADGGDAHVTTTWNFRNNIVANYGTGGYNGPYGENTVYDHNLFAGNHPATEPADAAKLTADPQFVGAATTAPTGIGSVAGYQVATTSPAAGSGAVVTNNGGHDYFGRTVSATAAPTRGFHEANSF